MASEDIVLDDGQFLDSWGGDGSDPSSAGGGSSTLVMLLWLLLGAGTIACLLRCTNHMGKNVCVHDDAIGDDMMFHQHSHSHSSSGFDKRSD